MAPLRTQVRFTLPKGYVDVSGAEHRTGSMRLATGRDELEPLRDPRILGPEDPYLTVLVLARVVTELGTVPSITAEVVEGMFASDLDFLQDLYGVLNFGTDDEVAEVLSGATPDLLAVEHDEGGRVIRYPVDVLWDEVAYLAYHLHWPLDDLLDLEHGDRVQLLGSVACLNERAWETLHDVRG